MQKIKLMTFACILGLLTVGCDSRHEPTTKEFPAVPVIAAIPEIKDITTYLESLGTLHASVLLEIHPQTSGPLSRVFVSEGQWVRKGDPLFKIDTRLYQIKVQEAVAQLTIDQAGYQALQKKLERFRDLAKKDLIPQVEWEELEAQTEKAKGVIALDEARLNAAKLDLEHCTLTSPIAGRVGKLDVHPGLLVSNSQPLPLTTISSMDPLFVEFTVTEKEFSKIPREGLKIEVLPHCTSEICKEATVTFLDNHFDSKTGLLLVRGKVENSDYSLRPGQAAQVRIPISIDLQSKIIPQKAVRYNQAGPYVYVVQSDMTVAVRQLVLGKELGSNQIVKEGLDALEHIILDGHLRLSTGTKVEIK
jgi:multidrug efflux system membrane fusion protein